MECRTRVNVLSRKGAALPLKHSTSRSIKLPSAHFVRSQRQAHRARTWGTTEDWMLVRQGIEGVAPMAGLAPDSVAVAVVAVAVVAVAG